MTYLISVRVALTPLHKAADNSTTRAVVDMRFASRELAASQVNAFEREALRGLGACEEGKQEPVGRRLPSTLANGKWSERRDHTLHCLVVLPTPLNTHPALIARIFNPTHSYRQELVSQWPSNLLTSSPKTRAPTNYPTTTTSPPPPKAHQTPIVCLTRALLPPPFPSHASNA